jgi:hypothetical protein
MRADLQPRTMTGLASFAKTLLICQQVLASGSVRQTVSPGRYSPPACTGTKVKVRLGDPDLEKISTSYDC